MSILAKGMLILLAAALPALASAQTRTLKIQRLDDSYITAYLDAAPVQGRAPILLQFQGSICEAIGPTGRGLLPFKLPGAVSLSLEKYGLEQGTSPTAAPCPEDYLAHNTIDQRVFDALTVLAALRADAPWWDGRLFVAGVSEGATVAALVGGFSAETQGMVLINGAVGEPFRDGWTQAMVASSAPDKADAVRGEAERVWAQARANPTGGKTAFGGTNTYKWWASIIDLRVANLLLGSRVPVLVLQSERDRMTPLTSAQAMAARFQAAHRPDFTFEVLEGLDHGFRDAEGLARWEEPIDRASGWLAQHALLKATPASPK